MKTQWSQFATPGPKVTVAPLANSVLLAAFNAMRAKSNVRPWPRYRRRRRYSLPLSPSKG